MQPRALPTVAADLATPAGTFSQHLALPPQGNATVSWTINLLDALTATPTHSTLINGWEENKQEKKKRKEKEEEERGGGGGGTRERKRERERERERVKLTERIQYWLRTQ